MPASATACPLAPSIRTVGEPRSLAEPNVKNVGIIGLVVPGFNDPKSPYDIDAIAGLIWKKKEWSGREDLNLRPPGPEPGALPG